jgi:hypothetical protein
LQQLKPHDFIDQCSATATRYQKEQKEDHGDTILPDFMVQGAKNS